MASRYEAYGTNFIENEIRVPLDEELRMITPHKIDGAWCIYSIYPTKIFKAF